MPSAIYTQNFGYDPGLADQGLTPNITGAYDFTQGNPAAGSFQITGTQLTTEKFQLALGTWKLLGVPVNATVTSIHFVMFNKSNWAASAQIGLAVRVLSGGVNICSSDLLSFNRTTPYAWTQDTGSDIAVNSLYQGPNTAVVLEVEFAGGVLGTTGGSTFGTGIARDVNLDSFQLVINYTTSGGSSMPNYRPSETEGFQYAIESVAGTALAANKRTYSGSLVVDTAFSISTYSPPAARGATGAVQSKEYTTAQYNGYLDANFAHTLLGCWGATSPGVGTPAKIYSLTIVGTPSAGSFTLTCGGGVATIAFGAITASNIGQQLEGMAANGGVGNWFVEPVLGTTNQFTIRPQLGNGLLATTVVANFAGLTGATASTFTNISATNAKRWNFALGGNIVDAISTMTVERGQIGQANLGIQMAFSIFDSLKLAFNDQKADVNATLFGRTKVDPFTLTVASITEVPTAYLPPTGHTLFLGASSYAISRLAAGFEFELDTDKKWMPKNTLDDQVASFTNIYDVDYKAKGKVAMHNDAVGGQAWLTSLRALSKLWLRMETKGLAIDTGYPYRVMMTMPIYMTDQKVTSLNGVESAEFPFMVAYDSSFGSTIKFEVDNIQTTL